MIGCLFSSCFLGVEWLDSLPSCLCLSDHLIFIFGDVGDTSDVDEIDDELKLSLMSTDSNFSRLDPN